MKTWTTWTVGCDRCPATCELTCRRLSAKVGAQSMSVEQQELPGEWKFVQVQGARVLPTKAPQLDLALPADELLKVLPQMELVLCPDCFERHRTTTALEAGGLVVGRG